MNALKILKKSNIIKPCDDLVPFPVSNRSAEDGYSWNGKNLAVGGRSYEEFLHELSHWYVASNKQRERVEFGLGANAMTKFVDLANKARCVSKKECWRQEEEASILQILIMREQGLNYFPTLDAHGWIDWVELDYNNTEAARNFKKSVTPVLKRLIKKKLIDKTLNVLV